MKTQTPRKFSIKEIHAAGLTLEQVRTHKLLVDKRKKGMSAENISYLKSLGIPPQYTGPIPQPRVKKTQLPKQRKAHVKKPKQVTKSAAKPAVKPVKKATTKTTTKPTTKPTTKVTTKPKAKAKTETKPAPKPVTKVTTKPKAKSETKPVKVEEKNSFNKIESKSLDPKVQEAIANIFQDTPLFSKKADLLEAIEKHTAKLTELKPDQLLNRLKNENIIKYSRTAPRGYSLN
ncbi:MAG: hypothetical protein DRO88_05875 [Promethearchaeia archaeon]|nr:MAG: hypothetical protein DRO88_05875 [Candidatus Lokiarchaeia archaeon]